MEWRLFADLAEHAGTKRVSIDGDPDDVGAALDRLLEEHPDLESRVLTDGGERSEGSRSSSSRRIDGSDVREHVNVLRNGTNVDAEGEGLETAVEDDDELALFPPVSGG